ncbi:RNase H family protein [Cereibacter sphaeroides]|jgi:ribonuclease HI|uniref:RNase H family protein n=1 Tax=Cereibacter sphaeroides TaxID=1063 RepID=UPI0000663E3A|nr:ribonuclease H [Cereibacter sphaeroides ATCC 17029]
MADATVKNAPSELIHSPPSLTIFADASVIPQQQVAGWGGWARGNGRQPLLEGGPVPFAADSTLAELHALASMIERIHETGYMLPDDRSVLLQSDSLGALGILNLALENSWASKRAGSADIKRARTIKPAVEVPIRRIVSLLDGTQVVYLRHVRGHEKGRHARSWVNEQCDKRAKAEARAQIGGGNG